MKNKKNATQIFGVYLKKKKHDKYIKYERVVEFDYQWKWPVQHSIDSDQNREWNHRNDDKMHLQHQQKERRDGIAPSRNILIVNYTGKECIKIGGTISYTVVVFFSSSLLHTRRKDLYMN